MAKKNRCMYIGVVIFYWLDVYCIVIIGLIPLFFIPMSLVSNGVILVWSILILSIVDII